MKKFTVAAAMGIALVANSAAADIKFSPSHERMLVNLCEAVQSNRKLKLISVMKQYRISHRQLQQGLVCNGQDPITFAMLNGAEQNAELIASRTRAQVDGVLASN